MNNPGTAMHIPLEIHLFEDSIALALDGPFFAEISYEGEVLIEQAHGAIQISQGGRLLFSTTMPYVFIRRSDPTTLFEGTNHSKGRSDPMSRYQALYSDSR